MCVKVKLFKALSIGGGVEEGGSGANKNIYIRNTLTSHERYSGSGRNFTGESNHEFINASFH